MDLPKKFNKFTEEYSNDKWFKAAISGIPIFGSSLDAFLSTQGQKIIHQRVEKLLEELKKEISSLQENQIPKDYITSPEFFDLFRITLEAAVKTRQEEKIRIYAQILKGTIQNPAETEKAENYIRVIAELSLQDIKIAKILYEQQKDIENSYELNSDMNDFKYVTSHGWDELPKIAGLKWHELSHSFHNLQRAGLIVELTGAFSDYVGGVFKVTYTFKRIMSFLT